MKYLLRTTVILLVTVATLGLQSCGGGEKVKDEKLSSFMLGGMYFYNGFGGIDAVESMVSSAGYTTDEEIISGYKEIFEFPFTSEQKSDIISVLSDMWEINNKEELLKTLEELKTEDSEHKAWDYARIVNNVCMGYAADYITKEEGTKIVEALLPLARERYADWKAYFNDFDAGRKAWNANDPQGASFEKIVENVGKNPKSIYTILPLK